MKAYRNGENVVVSVSPTEAAAIPDCVTYYRTALAFALNVRPDRIRFEYNEDDGAVFRAFADGAVYEYRTESFDDITFERIAGTNEIYRIDIDSYEFPEYSRSNEAIYDLPTFEFYNESGEFIAAQPDPL